MKKVNKVKIGINEASSNLNEVLNIASKEIQEVFSITPEWKEKVINMIKAFPNLPNTIEDMVMYYIRNIEYFELYTLDPFDPRLDRIEQKLSILREKLGLQSETSKNVQLKARQLTLAYA